MGLSRRQSCIITEASWEGGMFLIMDFIEQSPQISFHNKIDLIKIIFSSDISPTPYHSLKNWPLSVSWTAEWLCGTAVQNTEHILQDLTAGREWERGLSWHLPRGDSCRRSCRAATVTCTRWWGVPWQQSYRHTWAWSQRWRRRYNVSSKL